MKEKIRIWSAMIIFIIIIYCYFNFLIINNNFIIQKLLVTIFIQITLFISPAYVLLMSSMKLVVTHIFMIYFYFCTCIVRIIIQINIIIIIIIHLILQWRWIICNVFVKNWINRVIIVHVAYLLIINWIIVLFNMLLIVMLLLLLFSLTTCYVVFMDSLF